MPTSLNLISSKNTNLLHFSSFQRPSPRHNFKRYFISCKLGKIERTNRNPYEVLSLNQSEDVGVDEIKKAYRAMALQYHPDVCPASKREEFTRVFVEVHKAYKTLSDPILRRRYDHELGLSAWEIQLLELKRRSDMKNKREGSWGSRMRAQRS